MTRPSEVTRDFSRGSAQPAPPRQLRPRSAPGAVRSRPRILSPRHVSFTEPPRSRDSVGGKSRKAGTGLPRKFLETKCYPRSGAESAGGGSRALGGARLAARHAGDTGSGDPATHPLLSHPPKLAQLPRAGVRGRAQDPERRRAAGGFPQPQVTNGSRASTEAPSLEITPQIRNRAGELPKPARNCGSREAERPGGGPRGFARPQPELRALCSRNRGERGEGRGAPSASLHRPRRRKGGSGEGATQTVALGKLRPQFFQVCPSERRGMGTPLGALPSRRGHPRGPRAPRPARREPPSKGAQGRESGGREGGKEGAPACAHNEAAETHT